MPNLQGLKGSAASITSLVGGIIIAVFWFYKTPDFEPLLAILTGLGAAVAFKKAGLSPKVDWLFATLITLVLIVGLFYLLSPKYNNHSPVIHNITVNRTTVSPGEMVNITVDATDMDNDPLSYVWSTNRGIVPSGNRGQHIIYTAPHDGGAGIDIIKVTVTDGKGGTATQETTIAIQNQD